MKIMSILGIIWFSFCLIGILAFINSNPERTIGFGLLGMLYAIPYAIVGLVKSIKKAKVE